MFDLCPFFPPSSTSLAAADLDELSVPAKRIVADALQTYCDDFNNIFNKVPPRSAIENLLLSNLEDESRIRESFASATVPVGTSQNNMTNY